MQKFEEIIEQTFAKIDASNPKMRQKVYENIWFLQEKALAEQNAPADIRQERRAELTQLLKRVETRCRAQYAAPAPAAPVSASRLAPQPSPSQRQTARMQEETVRPQPEAEHLPPETEITSPSPAPAAAKQADAYMRAESARSRQADYPPEQRSHESRHPARQNNAPSLDPVIDAPRRKPAARAEDYAGDDAHHGLIDRLKMKWADRRAAKQAQRQARKDKSILAADPDDNLDPEYAEDGTPIPAPRRKSRWGAYLFTISFIFVLCFTGWTFYTSFGSPESKRARQALMTAPLKQNAYDKNGWDEVLNPANASGIKVKGSAVAELHKEPDANFIRITTQQPSDAVQFSISGSALQSLRGKSADFKLMARSADDQIGPMRLIADFGSGNQQIYKFELSPTEKPLLFSLDIPSSVRNGVKLYIGNEAPAGAHEIDIYSLLTRSPSAPGKL